MGGPSRDETRIAAEYLLRTAAIMGGVEVKRHGMDLWAAAVNELLDREDFEAARYALSQLCLSFPDAEFITNLTVVLDRLPEAGGQTPFFDDPTTEFQIAKRPGADTAVILFCGGGTHRLGMPLNAFHRWAGHMPAHLIYLRDFRDDFFLDGVGSIATGWSATVDFLRAAIAELGARRILCYGFSVGGFAALQYGLALRAQRVLALGAPVDLEPTANLFLRWSRPARRLKKRYGGVGLNLVQQYRSADDPPQVLLSYGEQNWDDRLHAERMRGLPFAELCPVADFAGHNPVIELIDQRAFTPLLERFVG